MSRAIGGYALTFDDHTPGSLTVFQSARVARPQDATKAPCLVSLLRSSARSYLGTCKQRVFRPVSEVPDMDTSLGLAGRCVDPVFQHSPRHNVGFFQGLVKAGSIRFVEDAVEHVWLFLVAKSVQQSPFFETSSWTVACRRGTFSCRISWTA